MLSLIFEVEAMGCFWNIQSLAFVAFVILKIEASAFEKLNLQRILLAQIQTQLENNVAKCVLSIVYEIDKRFTENIQINIEANSPNTREEFLNTVVEFISNNDRSTYETASNRSESYKTYFRIYFVESVRSLENSLRKLHHHLFPQDPFYIIIILPKDTIDLRSFLVSIFEVLWKMSIINVNALIEDQNGIVTLYTYFPFEEQRCRDISPQVIGRYINGSFTFKTSHFPDKISNFWNCPINVVTFDYPPYTFVQQGKMKGFDGLVLQHLADLFNFSVKIIISPAGLIYLNNQTYTGGFKMLNDGIADLMIEDSICTRERARFFASSHYNTYYKNLIFRTDLTASSLKTLALPFDLSTWIVILGFSIYKWFARHIWQKMFRHNQYQKGTYNWFIIGPYILSFLIIRSLYEGSIFKILHNRPIGVRPNSFDEAIRQGYKFMVTPDQYFLHSIIPELKNHIVVVNSTNLMETFFQTEGKYSFLASKEHMATYSKGRIFFMAQKPLLTSNTCIHMPKLSYMTNKLNKRINYLRTFGHMDKIKTIFSNIKLSSKTQSNKSQAYFSIKHLMGAFHLYCILISMSSLIFILEIFSTKNRRLKKALDVFDKSIKI